MTQAFSDRSCLEQVMHWSRDRDFRGHSKHDALNSPLLNALSLGTRPLRLVAIQALMRAPWNLRKLFGIPELRNPKGIGLFAHAAFDLAEVSSGSEREQAIALGTDLLSWLVQRPSPWTACPSSVAEQFEGVPPSGYRVDGPEVPSLSGMGWGYHYPWQDVGFFQPRHFPNRVVSSWIGFAFIRAYEVTKEDRFLQAAEAITRFLLENPKRLVDSEDALCLSYVPTEDIDWAVMDVSVLVAALCAMVGRYLPERRDLHETAHRLTRFVVDKQTDYGAWFYTWPKGDSHITHDNYHTGIIIDCIADVMTYTGDHVYLDAYRAGLDHYWRDLFREDGAPKWMHNKDQPHDIHGCAAGMLCFSRAAEFERKLENEDRADTLAAQGDRVREWTMGHLYDLRGYFYYQKTRAGTKRFNLMRWANGWMCRALSQRLRFEQG